ncbi:DNA-3-methyladenine glycosylase [Pseudactinotalea sp. HY158]|nr:DNA-3-methyladenine glycosylase [Pseudactinotalea sp. HY158]
MPPTGRRRRPRCTPRSACRRGPRSGWTAAAGSSAGSDVAASIDLSRRSTELAPELLGAELVSTLGGARVRLRITEVEAYEGLDDPASHAFRGPTNRNRVMFGPPAHLYVYRHLGLHHCANLVVGPAGTASAVLLRAGEILDGAETAWQRRNDAGVCRRPVDLARGPARLTVALGIRAEHDGIAVSLEDDAAPLRLERTGRVRPADVRTGPRVGVSGAGADPQAYPWRYWLAGDEHVSAYRIGSPRR